LAGLAPFWRHDGRELFFRSPDTRGDTSGIRDPTPPIRAAAWHTLGTPAYSRVVRPID
jgi:hypothetical protein